MCGRHWIGRHHSPRDFSLISKIGDFLAIRGVCVWTPRMQKLDARTHWPRDFLAALELAGQASARLPFGVADPVVWGAADLWRIYEASALRLQKDFGFRVLSRSGKGAQ
jgi:hypothetical protein